MKILLVTTVHGDEDHAHQVGVELADLLRAKLKPKSANNSIDILVAHPEAREAGKRFLETDLNRSFGVGLPLSIEEKLAVGLAKKIKSVDYDLVIDMHNTKADGTTCAIVVNEPSELQLMVTKALGLDKIVQMPPSGSLLSALPEFSKGVSIEIADSDTDKFPAKKLAKLIMGLRDKNLQPAKTESHEIKYYHFSAPLLKSTLDRAGLEDSGFKNFRKLTKAQIAKLGITSSNYYPIFLGGKHMGESAMILVVGNYLL